MQRITSIQVAPNLNRKRATRTPYDVIKLREGMSIPDPTGAGEPCVITAIRGDKVAYGAETHFGTTTRTRVIDSILGSTE